jgi:hypothetical protein
MAGQDAKLNPLLPGRVKSKKRSARDAAPARVTPAVVDAVAELEALVGSQLRAGAADVGTDFQMRLARAEGRLVEELQRAGLPPIVPRQSRPDGTHFTPTDLPFRQREGMQCHRCVFVPDAKWKSRLLTLSIATPRVEPAAGVDVSILDEIGNAWLSCADIARHNGLNEKALAKRLETFRRKSDDGWRADESSSRRPRDPKYVYKLASVQPIVADMKAKDEESTGRTNVAETSGGKESLRKKPTK